ncbi:MAG: site-2 protease family protein [Flavobacteriales bacterium]|nr:site-2 protease family protein [Flavobacteriales bacterium]
MKSKLSLGSIAGIKLFVHWTFSLLLLYIIYTGVSAGSGLVDILWSLAFILSIFGCVVLHELGHALAARRYGIGTRDITLLPIGGVASLESMPEKPSEELVVALAGPAVNLVIVLLLLPFMHLMPQFSEMEQAAAVNGSNFLLMFMTVNMVLAFFNLLPAFPMDGGRVLRALLAMRLGRAKATRIAATVGQVCAAGFVILGFYGNPFLILIGVFIFLGARSEANYTQTRSMLSGFTVKDVLLKQFSTLRSDDPVAKAVQMLLDGQCSTFLVVDNGLPVGILTRDAIIKALSDNGDGTPVSEVMDADLHTLSPNMRLQDVFQQMQQHRKEMMPVMDNGRLVGALDQENITEFVMIMTARAK